MTGLASPCINVCTLDLATDTCLGCGRTLREIERWTFFTDGERAAINAGLSARLGWPASQCSRCGESFTCGATDCSTPCWCASYPPATPEGEARCMCPACLAVYSSRVRPSQANASE